MVWGRAGWWAVVGLVGSITFYLVLFSMSCSSALDLAILQEPLLDLMQGRLALLVVVIGAGIQRTLRMPHRQASNRLPGSEM